MSHQNEFTFGKKIGLTAGLILSQKCADFYVLEDLENKLTQQHFYNDKGRFTGPRFAKDFGWDTRAELQAQDVIIRLSALEESLSRELALYILVACGGELRHVEGRLNIYTHRRKVCDHAVCDSKYCGHGDKDRDDCIEFACILSPSCWKVLKQYRPSPRIRRFLKQVGTVSKKPPYSDNRATSWKEWYKLSKRSPAVWLRECVVAFNASIWFGNVHETPVWIPPPCGYGGPNWALAASLAADYYAGVLRPRTFLDRCWSLQHNTGSLFNKFYIYSENRGLMKCLEVQASNNYEALMGYCSPHVASLWCENNKTSLSALSAKFEKPMLQEWPFSEESGCLACFQHYCNKGELDECGAGTPTSVNPDCAYSLYDGEDDDEDDDE